MVHDIYISFDNTLCHILSITPHRLLVPTRRPSVRNYNIAGLLIIVFQLQNLSSVVSEGRKKVVIVDSNVNDSLYHLQHVSYDSQSVE